MANVQELWIIFDEMRKTHTYLDPDTTMRGAIAVYKTWKQSQNIVVVDGKTTQDASTQTAVPIQAPIMTKHVEKDKHEERGAFWDLNLTKNESLGLRKAPLKQQKYHKFAFERYQIKECDNCGGEDCNRFDGCMNDDIDDCFNFD